MGSYFSFMKHTFNSNAYVKNEYVNFNRLNKYNEPLKYNVNIIKHFKPSLDTIYE